MLNENGVMAKLSWSGETGPVSPEQSRKEIEAHLQELWGELTTNFYVECSLKRKGEPCDLGCGVVTMLASNLGFVASSLFCDDTSRGDKRKNLVDLVASSVSILLEFDMRDLWGLEEGE